MVRLVKLSYKNGVAVSDHICSVCSQCCFSDLTWREAPRVFLSTFFFTLPLMYMVFYIS